MWLWRFVSMANKLFNKNPLTWIINMKITTILIILSISPLTILSNYWWIHSQKICPYSWTCPISEYANECWMHSLHRFDNYGRYCGLKWLVFRSVTDNLKNNGGQLAFCPPCNSRDSFSHHCNIHAYMANTHKWSYKTYMSFLPITE